MTYPNGYERDPLVYPASPEHTHIWRRSDRVDQGPCDLCGLPYLDEVHTEAHIKYAKQKRDSQRRFKQVQRVYNENVWVIRKSTVISVFIGWVIIPVVAAYIRSH